MKKILKNLTIQEKNPDGTPMTNKAGRIYAVAYADFNEGFVRSMYLNPVFDQMKLDQLRKWEVGKEYDVLLSEKNDFKNWRPATKVDLLVEEMADVQRRVKALERANGNQHQDSDSGQEGYLYGKQDNSIVIPPLPEKEERVDLNSVF